MTAFKTILLTTDFSALAARAAAPARELAAKLGAKVLLLHVVEDRVPPFLEELLADHDDMLENQRRRAAGELAAFGKEHLKGVSHDCRVALGMASEQIVKTAAEAGADMIVMATHGRGPLGHAIIGSTTERVLHRAPCPVLAVRVETGQ